MKFQIFKEKVVFLEDNGIHLRTIPLAQFPFSEYPKITEAIKHSQKKDKDGFCDYGYTEKCVDCGKLDYIVQGYCKPCFDKHGCRYEFERGI